MNQKLEPSVESKIHEDLSPTRNLSGIHLKIVASIAIVWSLFQLWYASPFPFWFNIGMFKGTTELTSSQQVKALCDGKIDAFGYSVGFPNGAMEEAATCAAKAMPINLTGGPVQGLIDGADYYAKAVIPKGTYTGQKKDVTTFGVKATFVTGANVSEELVYLVTKAVMENFEDFKKQHPAFAFLEKKNMIKDGLSAPLHPGAMKYYKEAGLM